MAFDRPGRGGIRRAVAEDEAKALYRKSCREGITHRQTSRIRAVVDTADHGRTDHYPSSVCVDRKKSCRVYTAKDGMQSG